MFGDAMPIKAWALIANPDAGKTNDDVRKELKEIAAKTKDPVRMALKDMLDIVDMIAASNNNHGDFGWNRLSGNQLEVLREKVNNARKVYGN